MEGDRPEARARLVRVLQEAPYYHPAVRLLGEIAIRDGDRQGACLYLWVYDQLFRGRSAAHYLLRRWCGDTPPVEVPEAPHGATLYRVLFLSACVLFVMTFLVNTAAELVRQHLREKYRAI